MTDEQIIIGDQDYVIRRPHVGVPLLVRCSHVVTKIFYDAAQPDRPREVAAAIAELARVDGVVFVVDSQMARRTHNIGWLRRLEADIVFAGGSLDTLPVVFQLNKRDLVSALSVAELKEALYSPRCAYVESVAPRDDGPQRALEALVSIAGWSDLPYRGSG